MRSGDGEGRGEGSRMNKMRMCCRAVRDVLICTRTLFLCVYIFVFSSRFCLGF